MIMKRFITGILLMITSLAGHSQSTDPKPGSPIPSFRMLQTDGKYYSDKDIPKNRPVVLIYFAPDCDHCIKMMDELFKKIRQLDKSTVVLVTFKPVNDLPWFEKKYQTGKFPNISVGTEGTSYILRNYYRLDRTPFTAVYDKKGQLAFSYKDETPVNAMLDRFKKL